MFSSVLSVSAQDITTTAIHDIGTNCANLALNTTCLAHGSVQRTTSSGLVSTTYAQPGDRASITTTHQIATAPVGADGDFGVNVMKVQAGLPAASGGLIYIAFAGTTVTNVGGAGQAVWQNISVKLDANAAAAAGAPTYFLVQAPKGVAATITVNGQTITLHSTVLIGFGPTGITVFVVEGSITVKGQTVAAGEKITFDGLVGTVSPITAADFAKLQFVLLLPGNVLQYILNQLPVIICPSGVGGASCTTTSG